MQGSSDNLIEDSDNQGRLYSFFDLQACSVFIDNVSRKRVAQKTNNRQTETCYWQGDGQQPDSDNHLRLNSPDCICPVVEISCPTGHKGLCNQYLCPAHYHNKLIAA